MLSVLIKFCFQVCLFLPSSHNYSPNPITQVSVVGVTGARANVNPRVKDLLKEIRQVTDKEIAVGFGISTPDHVSQVIKIAY